jgi:hypothetical protein
MRTLLVSKSLWTPAHCFARFWSRFAHAIAFSSLRSAEQKEMLLPIESKRLVKVFSDRELDAVSGRGAAAIPRSNGTLGQER